MKRLGAVLTTFVFLFFLGVSVPLYSQQEHPDDKEPKPEKAAKPLAPVQSNPGEPRKA